MWYVNVWEFESGWGSKIDYQEDFQTKELAESFVKAFNAKNDQDTVPDWYMMADGPYLRK